MFLLALDCLLKWILHFCIIKIINFFILPLNTLSSIYYEHCFFFTTGCIITVVIQLKPEQKSQTNFIFNIFCLFSALWDFRRSILGLKRTPHWSLTQLTQIGRDGVLSREPTFRFLLTFPFSYQARNPISFLSEIPNFPSII